MAEGFELERFVTAQEGVYEAARAELAAGQKRSHWMWFIFPQVRGLGSSAMAQRFAISGLAEAEAYLRHPLLGARLRECTALVNEARGCTLEEIFGHPDDLKFYSCMTLFDWTAKGVPGLDGMIFTEALGKHFNGAADEATLRILGAGTDGGRTV